MILDCTFRDGGYYTNWHFSAEVFSQYLYAVEAAGITYAEVGFRGVPYKDEHGPHADITDSYLNSFRGVSRLKKTKLAVMVNAKDYLADRANFIGRNFALKQYSPISLVRIAASPDEAAQCEELCAALSYQGYMVAMNLMRCGGPHIWDLTKEINRWDSVDVLYLADSLGIYATSSIHLLFDDARAFWEGDLGFHAHNNKGLALANTLAAAEWGVPWLDGTLMGMGRGAGNAPIEQLLVALDDYGVQTAKGDYDQLFDLALTDFTKMQGIYRWGPSLPYYLSATQNTHPTYVQEMLSRGQFSRLALGKLLGALTYDPDQLRDALGETALP